MERNRLLFIVLKLSKIAGALILFLMAIIIISVLVRVVQPEFFSQVHTYLNKEGFFHIAFSTVGESDEADGTLSLAFGAYTVSAEETNLTVDELSWGSFIFNCIQLLLVLFMYFLIIRELIRVITSIKDLNTFQSRNSKSFYRFGMIFLALFFIGAFTFVSTSEFTTFLFTIHLTPLFLMLGSFVLAEIFKEGNILLQENQLTI